MAKKNSSKTATEKAMSASNPKMQTFTGWNGINIRESQLDWYPMEAERSHYTHQTDLQPKNFLLQNNLITAKNLTLETRPDSIQIGNATNVPIPYKDASAWNGAQFTGVCCMYRKWLFAVVRFTKKDQSGYGIKWEERIIHRDLTNPIETWYFDYMTDAETLSPVHYEITEIGYYEQKFIVLTRHWEDLPHRRVGEMFVGDIKYDPETNMLLAGPSRYDEWDDSIIEDLHNKAQKKNKSDKER